MKYEREECSAYHQNAQNEQPSESEGEAKDEPMVGSLFSWKSF